MTGLVFRQHQESQYCQECGQPLQFDFKKIGVTLRPDQLLYKSSVVKLAPREHSIMTCLLKAWPEYLPRERLFASIWVDNTEIKILDVYICKLRKKFRDIGIKIETAYGIGYRVVLK